jgi:peroxiredoxin
VTPEDQMIEQGAKPPDFTLPDQNGQDVTLPDLRGRVVEGVAPEL